MKIAYIAEPRKVIGGGVRAAINLVKAMKQYYEEDAMVFGVNRGTIKDKDVELIEVDTLNPMSMAYWKALKQFLKSYHPDVVHCLGLYSALVLVMQRQFYGLNFKIICTVHRVTMNMRFRSMLKVITPYIAKHIDFTTFLTRYQKKHYFENVGFRPMKHIIVPNVIFVDKHSENETVAKRKELETKVGTNLLTCFVGRIVPSKNIEDTIRLVGILNRRGVKLGCILVGGYEQSYYERLDQLPKAEGVRNRILFEGYVNNPTLYNAACTTTTFTTYSEALPNLMVETFALGKVLFSSDIPQMVDLIDDGRNGYTNSLADLEGMADRMEEIYQNEVLRKSIGKQALATYEEIYNPRKVAAKYHDIYESC